MKLVNRYREDGAKYGVPEAPEASKNLLGARGFIFPKYEPMAIHGDPIDPQHDLTIYEKTRETYFSEFRVSETIFN